MSYTWTNLVDDIKVRGMIPTNQSTYTPARLLNLTNAVMQSKVVPMVMRAREGYYSYDFPFSITGALTGYAIPARAVGGKLENVWFSDGQNHRQRAARYYEEDIEDYTINPNTEPGFFIKRNRIFPLPPSGTAQSWNTLELTILMRPNQIVDPVTDAAQITGISGNIATCSAGIPSSWATSSTFDIIQDTDHFDWWAIDQTITAISSTTITFTSAIPSTVAVGDWIALARNSPIPQCPREFFPYLAQCTANIVLRAQGDQNQVKAGEEEEKLLLESLVAVITPRVEQEGKKIVSHSGIIRRRM